MYRIYPTLHNLEYGSHISRRILLIDHWQHDTMCSEEVAEENLAYWL